MVKHFDQTTFTNREAGTHGDCTRACVRMLLSLEAPDLELDLPHPISDATSWNMDFFDTLEEHGFDLRYQPVYPGKDYSFLPRILAAGGPTPRTELTGASHMVVYDRIAAEVVHDPHPSRAGLIAIDGFYWLAAA